MIKNIPPSQVLKVGDVADAGEVIESKRIDQSQLGLEQALSKGLSPSDHASHVLEQQFRLLKATLDSISDAVMIVDAELEIVAFNCALEQLTGWQRERVVGQHCWEIFNCGESSTIGQNGYHCPLAEKTGYAGSCLKHTFTSSGGTEVTVSMGHTRLPSPPYCGDDWHVLYHSTSTLASIPSAVLSAPPNSH